MCWQDATVFHPVPGTTQENRFNRFPMNWLAHLYLSDPNPAFRIGNLLPDIVPASELVDLKPEFRRGVEQHHRIDSFTDKHAIVRQSINRVAPPFRRYAGILTDVFYDHFLARQWDSFSSVALSDFVEEVHASFESHRADIPPVAYLRLEQIRAGNFLSSYGELSGVALTLERISRRLSRPVPLGDAVSVLEENYELFQSDFSVFFPELVSYLAIDPC